MIEEFFISFFGPNLWPIFAVLAIIFLALCLLYVFSFAGMAMRKFFRYEE